MKNEQIVKRSLRVGAILLAVVSASSARGETSYPLICRGGPGMNAEVWHYTSNGAPGVYTNISFRRGQTASNPGPGECVWIDRGFRASEPASLFYNVLSNQSQIFTVLPGGVTFGMGPLRYLLNAVNRQTRFYVHGYSRSGSISVTRLGP